MTFQSRDELIQEWKKLRVEYFNVYEENRTKFDSKYKEHPLYDSVVNNFDKSFRDVNQIVESEIDEYLSTHG